MTKKRLPQAKKVVDTRSTHFRFLKSIQSDAFKFDKNFCKKVKK